MNAECPEMPDTDSPSADVLRSIFRPGITVRSQSRWCGFASVVRPSTRAWCWLSMSMLASLVAFSASRAEEKKPYRPIGSPTAPKVAAQWNRYHDYAESSKFLADLAKAHPEFARLQSLGKSYGDREMWVMTITDFTAGDEQSKPGFWIDGAIHANEIQATEVVLYTAWYLLEMRGESQDIRRLLKERVFFLMPMMSPEDRKSTRLNSSHVALSRMPSSA